MTEFLQLSTTVSDEAEAQQLASLLVESRLAACVQIVPQVLSVYRWQGKIEQAQEWLCIAKTKRTLLPRVEAEILQHHSYDCPEIIATPIDFVTERYSDWLAEQLAD